MELKITKEKVLEAASKCSDAKNILKTLFPQVFENVIEFDEEHIYIYVGGGGGLYKLHYANDKWSFIHLSSSKCHADGFYDTPEKALSGRREGSIKKFDSMKSFLEWAVRQF